MKGLIKQLVRESLLMELGTAQVLPFQMTDEYTEIEKGIAFLYEIFYTFKVGSEDILCHFAMNDTSKKINGVYDFNYKFTFVSNSADGYTATNDLSTVFSKMMTIKEIINTFINTYLSEYETKNNRLNAIELVGAAEKGKEDTNDVNDTQRTRLYDYFLKKFKRPDFEYVKNGNIMTLQKIK